MDDYKYSMSLTVSNVTPAHVYFKVFSGMIPAEYRHEDAAGRGKVGDLCFRVEEVEGFLKHIQPNLLLFDNEDDVTKLVELLHLKDAWPLWEWCDCDEPDI